MSARVVEPITAEHNDTLGGLLYAYERPEERHLRRRTGYWRMVEERMVRDQLIAEGWPAEKYMGFEISRRVIANHKNDATYREIGEARAARQPPRVDTRFSPEELERLIEHFAGANDPVAQSILAKALAGLEPQAQAGTTAKPE
jgi:hypothetical protein